MSWLTGTPSLRLWRLIASCIKVRFQILLQSHCSWLLDCFYWCCYATYAINKAKEVADNVGNIDRLRDENIELNKLNKSMSAELKTAKERLVQAEQALEMEKQTNSDALREVQERLDKRLASLW